MESNCNNRNSMNCAHGHMHGYNSQMNGCSQMMQSRECVVKSHNCDCMTQQPRRGECMEQSKRGECQPCRREEQRGRVERVMNTADMQKHHCNGNVSVECVCQVTREKDCHRHDAMEQLGCEFPVVMAYVPWQQWGDLYEAECGLMQGTIFKDLNYIFCGERC